MDWDFQAFDEPQPQESGDRLDLEAGVHDLQILAVSETPETLLLELAHDDRRYWWVKCNLQKSQRWARILVGQLVGSLAMTAEEWMSTDSGDLVGRRVLTEVVHKVKPSGKTFVNVWKFMPIPQLEQEAVAKAAPKARTPAARVKAASPGIGSDDIPF